MKAERAWSSRKSRMRKQKSSRGMRRRSCAVECLAGTVWSGHSCPRGRRCESVPTKEPTPTLGRALTHPADRSLARTAQRHLGTPRPFALFAKGWAEYVQLQLSRLLADLKRNLQFSGNRRLLIRQQVEKIVGVQLRENGLQVDSYRWCCSSVLR